MKKLTAVLLIFVLFFTACGHSPNGVESLMEEVPARVVCLAEQPDCGAEAADFAIRLFQCSLEEETNTLISPLSVLSALAMTANGADGKTLTQMEATLGLPTGDLNAYLYSFLDGQSDQLKLANSIWFKDAESLQVSQDFLETNANYYHADLYKAAMDASTADAINSWVDEHTDGMIPKIMEEMDSDTVMCLINALAFDAKWEEIYMDHQVGESTFNTAGGFPRTVEYMNSTEYAYLEDAHATGFIKYYEGRDYAFVALLPNEDVTVAEYVDSLTGAHLQELLENPQNILTYASLPKFETDYSTELSGVLQAMGMTDAFDVNRADFSRMCSSDNGNIYISQVLHKTYISVAEEGTRAAAVTEVIMAEGAAIIEDYRKVVLNRPFLYMIIDCDENLPLFIGAMMDTEG